MWNKEIQKISDVTDSTVYQAGGNVTVVQGLTAKDVLDIVNGVVADKLAIYKCQAEAVAESRLKKFAEDLVSKLQGKGDDVLSKFNQPAVQMSVRHAALGYIQNGEDGGREDLIDLMMERVRVDEHSTRQHLIDKVIEVLPTLSVECIDLLTLLAFAKLVHTGNVHNCNKWFACMNPVLERLKHVTKLDADYLNQADCTYSMIVYGQTDFVERQQKDYDLLFRHEPQENFLEILQERLKVRLENGHLKYSSEKKQEWAICLLQIFDMSSASIKCNMTSLERGKGELIKKGYNDLADILQSYYDSTQPFSKEEVVQYFIDRNPNWETAFELLKRSDVASLNLKPVGVYIACKMLSKLAEKDVSMDIFYENQA